MMLIFNDINNKRYFVNSCNIVYLKSEPQNQENDTFNTRICSLNNILMSNKTVFAIHLSNNDVIKVSAGIALGIIQELGKKEID